MEAFIPYVLIRIELISVIGSCLRVSHDPGQLNRCEIQHEPTSFMFMALNHTEVSFSACGLTPAAGVFTMAVDTTVPDQSQWWPFNTSHGLFWPS